MPFVISLILIVILALSAVRGWRLGLEVLAVDLGGLLLATAAASLTYLLVARLLAKVGSIPAAFASLAAFLLVWFGVEFLYRLGIHLIVVRKVAHLPNSPSTGNRLGGAALGLMQMLLVASLSLMVLLALPLGGNFKDNLGKAFVSRQLIAAGSRYQQQVNNVVSDLSETLTFLTVKPKGEESIKLGFTTTSVSVDESAELSMLDLVNHERTSRGLQPLVMDDQIREIARAHSKDMFARGYFSHVTPEGLDPFDRMRAGGIKFFAAGENLALAPTLDLAHAGLMNSPGHRANILESSFHRVGIGVIDGGIYGKMFTQDFAD